MSLGVFDYPDFIHIMVSRLLLVVLNSIDKFVS